MRAGAVMLLLVAVAVPACGSGSGSGSSRGPGPDAPPPAGLESSCPPRDAPIRYAGGDLREGATSVRLCPGPPMVAFDGTVLDVGIQSPEVLTTQVDDLVNAVNALEGAPDEMTCLLDGGPSLTYWFSYPDGDARAVTVESFGCEVLIVGEGAARLEGDRVARLFTEALVSQRAAGTPRKAFFTSPDCSGVYAEPGTALPKDPVDLASASLCVNAGRDLVRAAEVPGKLLEQLGRELLADPMARDECVEPLRRPAFLVGYTPWGDRVGYSIDECGQIGMPRTPGWWRQREPTFRLSPELATQLDALSLGPPVPFTRRS